MIPTEQPDLTKDGWCVAIYPVTYDQAVVSGCVATLSMTKGGGGHRGGRRRRGGGYAPQTKVTLSKSNTERGTRTVARLTWKTLQLLRHTKMHLCVSQSEVEIKNLARLNRLMATANTNWLVSCYFS